MVRRSVWVQFRMICLSAGSHHDSGALVRILLWVGFYSNYPGLLKLCVLRWRVDPVEACRRLDEATRGRSAYLEVRESGGKLASREQLVGTVRTANSNSSNGLYGR